MITYLSNACIFIICAIAIPYLVVAPIYAIRDLKKSQTNIYTIDRGSLQMSSYQAQELINKHYQNYYDPSVSRFGFGLRNGHLCFLILVKTKKDRDKLSEKYNGLLIENKYPIKVEIE